MSSPLSGTQTLSFRHRRCRPRGRRGRRRRRRRRRRHRRHVVVAPPGGHVNVGVADRAKNGPSQRPPIFTRVRMHSLPLRKGP